MPWWNEIAEEQQQRPFTLPRILPRALPGSRAEDPWMTEADFATPLRPRESEPLAAPRTDGPPLPTMPLGPFPTGPVGPGPAIPNQPSFDPLEFATRMSDQAARIADRQSGPYADYGTFHNGLRMPQGSHDRSNERAAALGALQQAYQNLLPAHMQNQLGMGHLGLQGTMALGAPGLPGAMQIEASRAFGMPGIPGSIANAASDSINRTRENERFGPEARYDSFFNQAYNAFPPGTAHAIRIRQLQSQGMRPPEFLTGRQPPGAQQPGPGLAPANPALALIDQAFTTGLSGFPLNQQTGVRETSHGGNVGDAITNILAAIPDDNTLRANFPEIQRRLISEIPGGERALNEWMGQNYYTNPLTNNPLSTNPQRQQTIRQIQRLQRLAGNQAGPVNHGLPSWMPFASPLTMPIGAADYGSQFLRGLLGTR